MIITDSKVELTRVDGADLDVVNAARVSFDVESNWESVSIWNGDDEEIEQRLSDKDAKLIRYLAKHGHWSPLAHVGAQFRVKAPIFVARQLVKHQIGLVWNEVSRRYVKSAPEFYPMKWRWAAENVKQGSAGEMDEDMSAEIDEIFWPAVDHCLLAYEQMLDRGVAPEQARAVLNLNSMTEWVWTGSLVAWARICALRLDPHAQGETRDVAAHFDELLKPAFPVAWAALRGA
jgi:thymidylate synthase (FAD)